MNKEPVPRMWMVRAGRNGVLAQEFESKSCVAFADEQVANLATIASKEQLEQHLRKCLPNLRPIQLRMAVGRCARFVLEMKERDRVITYDPDRRMYLVGTITSKCMHQPGTVPDLVHVRNVKWEGQVPRDELSVATRNSLGSIMSVFQINSDAAREVADRMEGKVPPFSEDSSSEDSLPVDELRKEAEENGRRFLEDMVASLDWEQMQELVAGVLRAMGFKTRVSNPGPDQGKDIMASPDGLGLSQPRIVVEVKHHKSAVDSKMIRSFLGGRRPGDNGMFVSTGGFTKDARYEAERANFPLALVTLEELVDLLLQHYPNVDAETRALVPVVPIYWPASAS